MNSTFGFGLFVFLHPRIQLTGRVWTDTYLRTAISGRQKCRWLISRVTDVMSLYTNLVDSCGPAIVSGDTKMVTDGLEM